MYLKYQSIKINGLVKSPVTTKKNNQHLLRHRNKVKKNIRLKLLNMIMIMKANKIITAVMKMTQKKHNISHMKTMILLTKKSPMTSYIILYIENQFII